MTNKLEVLKTCLSELKALVANPSNSKAKAENEKMMAIDFHLETMAIEDFKPLIEQENLEIVESDGWTFLAKNEQPLSRMEGKGQAKQLLCSYLFNKEL